MRSRYKILLLFFLAVLVFTTGGFYVVKQAQKETEAPLDDQAFTAPVQNEQPASPPKNTVSKTPVFQIKGSIPYWEQNSAFSSFSSNVKSFHYLHLFWYYVTHEGTIETYDNTFEETKIIDFAHAHKVKVIPVLTNLPEGGSWDSHRIELILSDKKHRQEHIARIIEKLEELNFDGIDIDYEEVESSQKSNFSRFIEELAEALHKRNKILVVALHPKTAEEKDNESIGSFQDWKALGKHADQLNIMAYGQHYDESSAGPTASIQWVQKIVRYAKSLPVESSRFFLGISPDGYDWNKDNDESAKGVTFQEVEKLLKQHNALPKWDIDGKSPYFTYEEDGNTHEVWYENARSIQEKIALAKTAGFGGITVWRLGSEDPQMWKAVKTYAN